MTNRVKVTAVSYLNTKPFIYGLQHAPILDDIELTVKAPAVIASQLKNGEVDLGLVPVSIIPELKESHIIADFGIACDGPVSSVAVFSQVPKKDATRLFLDYQSRTSVALTRILVNDFWRIHPRMVEASPNYEKQIIGKYAGLVIGDRALKMRDSYDYVYDLGEEWKKFTGLPFVFAAWVANKPLDEGFIQRFNAALDFGVQHIPEVAAEQQPDYPYVDVADYLTHKIQFAFSDSMHKGLKQFLKLLPGNDLVAGLTGEKLSH